jgi:hypothetical protein
MKLHRLFPVLLVFALAVPADGREPVGPLLQAASKALDQYQQNLAPGFHCEDATTTESREACKITLETLGARVQEAKAEIARYRQLSSPQPVDLFDAYQAFRRVMELVESFTGASESYGERNRQLSAETYNSFVKITGWFGGVMRDTIRDADKCSERGHS